MPLAEWRAMGFDTHSVIADPMFVDPANDDYRPRANSPALKLGGGWVQSANFASECARKLLIL